MGSPYREQEMSDAFEPGGSRWPSIPWYVPVLLGVIGIGAAIDYIHTPGLQGATAVACGLFSVIRFIRKLDEVLQL